MQNKFTNPTKQEPKSLRLKKTSKEKQKSEKNENIPVRYSNFKQLKELINDTRDYQEN